MEYTPETVARMWWSLYGEVPASILEADPDGLYDIYTELLFSGGDESLGQEGFENAWELSIYLHNWDREPTRPSIDEEDFDDD